MRDSLDQYFPIGICAYKPEKGLFVKLGSHRYIMIDFYEKSVRVKDDPYNLMLHCEHEQPLEISAADRKLAEELLEANKERLVEDFARADAWIMHMVSDNCPSAGMYDQKYKELVQEKEWSAVCFHGCKGCIYAAEDIRCDERVVQSGFELQRCQKYPGTDKEGFADFKPVECLDVTKQCPYKNAEWKRE